MVKGLKAWFKYLEWKTSGSSLGWGYPDFKIRKSGFSTLETLEILNLMINLSHIMSIWLFGPLQKVTKIQGVPQKIIPCFGGL